MDSSEIKCKRKEQISKIYEVIEIFAISIIAVMLIFTFVARLSTVEGTSMFDTLEHGDRLVISNLFYTPRSGDIIVFQQSDGYFKEPLVKRVIAVGGQTVKIDFENWTVTVDGIPMLETYVTYEPGKTMKADDYYRYYSEYLDENGTMTIPEGYIFVMGDNRNHSSDSRFAGVGLVSESDIMGRAIFRLFPFSRIGRIE